jgi:hypothetical protein
MLLLQFHGPFPPCYKQAFLQHSELSRLSPGTQEQTGLRLILNPSSQLPTNQHTPTWKVRPYHVSDILLHVAFGVVRKANNIVHKFSCHYFERRIYRIPYFLHLIPILF